MKVFRLLCDFGVLVLVSLFLNSNIQKLGYGAGYQYLISAGIVFLIVLFISIRYEVFTQYKKSLLILVIFLIYLLLKLVIDIQDIAQIKAYTVGTSGGVIFAVVLGLMLSFIISDFYINMVKSKKASNFSSILIISYLCLLLWMFMTLYQTFYADIRGDYFLISDWEGNYQRPGNFIFMQVLLAGALVALLCSLRNIVNSFFIFLAVLLFIMISVFGMLLSQIIGSNSGFAATAGFFLVLLSYVYISFSRVFIEGMFRVGFNHLIFSRLGKKIITGITVVSIVVFGVGVILLDYLSFDLSKLRVFGFGLGATTNITTIRSLDSRIEIFQDNFIEQLNYNPVFGNAQVDVLTTGAGSYAHSILSILTHLGLIGFFIFCALLIQMYLEISKNEYSCHNLYSDIRYSLFRLFAMSAILVFALISAFYTWMPLWFAIGLLGVTLSDIKKYDASIGSMYKKRKTLIAFN